MRMSDEEKELEKAAAESTSEEASSARASSSGSSEAAAQLGNERRVQFAFVAMLVVFALLFDRLTRAIADQASQLFDLSQLDPKLATGIGLVVAIALTVWLYRNKSVHGFAHNVAGELARVKWPDREETMSNTVVVIITSIISALVVFSFDSIWAAITDLIYKV